MPLISEYARRFGVYEEVPNYLSYALGTGETTVMRMVTAYSMIANGGRRVRPTLIDRIQDRYGHTIFKHDARECRGCDAPGGWKSQSEPQLVNRREQVLDTMTAYQITLMMEDVVQHGTAIVVREVGKPIAGKTGTTNEAKDAWFVGFSPDLVVGIYMGYDKPLLLRRGDEATGGRLSGTIARDFFALADKPPTPFKISAGIKLVRVDARTGMRPVPGQTGNVIVEAFKPGTEPSDGDLAEVEGGTAHASGHRAGLRQHHAAGHCPALLARGARKSGAHGSTDDCASRAPPLHPTCHEWMPVTGAGEIREHQCAPKSNGW